MKSQSSAFMGVLVLVIAVAVVGAVVYMGGGTYTTLGEAAKTQPITLPICEPGFICNGPNEICYQNEKCGMESCNICEYGCFDNSCNPPPCIAKWVCDGSDKCYQSANCSITNCSNCDYGCTNGVCNVGCSDSDGGDYPQTKGVITTFEGSSFTDYCSKTGDLIEYYCINEQGSPEYYGIKTYFKTNFSCDTGYTAKCEDGAMKCVQETINCPLTLYATLTQDNKTMFNWTSNCSQATFYRLNYRIPGGTWIWASDFYANMSSYIYGAYNTYEYRLIAASGTSKALHGFENTTILNISATVLTSTTQCTDKCGCFAETNPGRAASVGIYTSVKYVTDCTNIGCSKTCAEWYGDGAPTCGGIFSDSRCVASTGALGSAPAVSCTAGYVCNGTSSCYRNTNCSFANCTNCTYGCTNGVCNNKPCSDSDGGIDYFSFGKAGPGYDNYGNFFSYIEDKCMSSTVVSDAYCINSTHIGTITKTCSWGCSSGVCNEAPVCTDTDGGDKPLTKGTVSVTGTNLTDYCSTDGTSLAEYYCASPTSLGTKTYYKTNYSCPAGYTATCADGSMSCTSCTKCWLPKICVDTQAYDPGWIFDPMNLSALLEGTYCNTEAKCQEFAPTCNYGIGGWAVCKANESINCCTKFWLPKTCQGSGWFFPCEPVTTPATCGDLPPSVVYKTGWACGSSAICTADTFTQCGNITLKCGDKVCNSTQGESCYNCEADCGVCIRPIGYSCTGNYQCNTNNCCEGICTELYANGIYCSADCECLSGNCEYEGTNTRVCRSVGTATPT